MHIYLVKIYHSKFFVSMYRGQHKIIVGTRNGSRKSAVYKRFAGTCQGDSTFRKKYFKQ